MAKLTTGKRRDSLKNLCYDWIGLDWIVWIGLCWNWNVNVECVNMNGVNIPKKIHESICLKNCFCRTLGS